LSSFSIKEPSDSFSILNSEISDLKIIKFKLKIYLENKIMKKEKLQKLLKKPQIKLVKIEPQQKYISFIYKENQTLKS